ncbi:MAG TPA: glycosyltransferase family 2 protein [Solirubrobacteraceae bacterium]|nr:glycosyltransferase family 2 protein [Solirubrobacteraceae bacterium]
MSSVSGTPAASIVVPTRARLDYLQVALSSLMPQATAAGSEVIVIDDAGPSEQARELCGRLGARYEPHPRPLGLNVARNSGIERSSGELIVFVDDDVVAGAGWLQALLDAARRHPSTNVFAGPIHVRLEGSPPHSCGREGPPITSLELGASDTRTRFAWGANMAIRRAAFQRVGPFDVSLEHGGDEQEWQERLAAPDGALYVAGAALVHRRKPADARLRPLCKAAYVRGRAARRFDAWRGQAPSLPRELRTLAGCFGHVVRRRCPMGLTMVAHSWGRVLEGTKMRTHPPSTPHRDRTYPHTPPFAGRYTNEDDFPSTKSTDIDDFPPATSTDKDDVPSAASISKDDFLSGESGTVGGRDGLRRHLRDTGEDIRELARARPIRLARAAQGEPPTRRVLALSIERPENGRLTNAIRAELARSRHHVELRAKAPGAGGKFENLNLLLDATPPESFDWLLALDDDIVLPRGFLDRFLFLCERFDLRLAQPAHRAASHAAWRVTRRQAGSVARQTRFVEIGPVTAFARSTFKELLPFPQLRMGWGLDLHWAALAAEQGWRCGVIDAVAISHRSAPAASAYSREQALAEARTFLDGRPYLTAAEAQQTLVTHRRW